MLGAVLRDAGNAVALPHAVIQSPPPLTPDRGEIARHMPTCLWCLVPLLPFLSYKCLSTYDTVNSQLPYVWVTNLPLCMYGHRVACLAIEESGVGCTRGCRT
jgi:hypothetical protein